MALHICEDIQQAKIIISDNGKGNSSRQAATYFLEKNVPVRPVAVCKGENGF